MREISWVEGEVEWERGNIIDRSMLFAISKGGVKYDGSRSNENDEMEANLRTTAETVSRCALV